MASRANSAESGASLRSKYLDLTRKYAALVERGASRGPGRTAIVTPTARLAGIAVALLDPKGKLLHCNARWKSIATPSLPKALVDSMKEPALFAPAVHQVQFTGQGGVNLLVRLEDFEGHLVALATEEARTSSTDDEAARNRLWQIERLRTLGQLAAGVAHDVVTSVRSVRYLLASLEADPLVRARCGETLQSMARGIDDSSQVLARLHDFVRTGAQPLQTVHLPALLHEAAKLYELDSHDAKAPAVALRIGRVPTLRASPGELTHVFLNLLRNARDASRPDSEISVTCALVAKAIRVSVADRGTGIRADAFPHLFEPFFTTKGERGTGLGLFLCASLIERIGGTIRAANRRSGGATFIVDLPLNPAFADRGAGPGESDRPASPRRKRGPRARRRSSPG